MEGDLLRVDNMNMLAEPDPSRLAKDISIVYQDPGTTFNPALRMGSQLTEVLRTHLGMGGAQGRHVITQALASVNITVVARWPGNTRMSSQAACASGPMIAASISSLRPS